MLSTTMVHVCARCGSERIRKNGHAGNGAQRAKCLECERTFILEPKGPRHKEAFKEQVVRAYQDRMSIRGITRTFGVYYKTILRWVGEKNPGPARLRGHALAWPERRCAGVG
jgi:transposase-like protein